jgi:hypothetical protein
VGNRKILSPYYQPAMSSDGIRDGIALRRFFKMDSATAHEFCLAAGVLVAEGWQSMVDVQGRIKRFARAYPKTAWPALKENTLKFPRGNCEDESAPGIPAVVVQLTRRLDQLQR